MPCLHPWMAPGQLRQARVVDGSLPPALHGAAWQSWPSLVHPCPVGGSTGEAGRCTAQVRLDRRYEEYDASMYRSIYTHVALSGACACLCVFLGWLLGGFDGVWLTPGLGATPGSWLRLRSKVAPVWVELSPSLRRRWFASSCSPWRGVAELALAHPRPVGGSTGKAGRCAGKVRSPT